MFGKHPCITFEMVGPSLLDLIVYCCDEREGKIPILIVKQIVRQILVGLDYMHRVCQVIHTDIKPENVVLQI